MTPETRETGRIFVDTWSAGFGSPYQIDDEDPESPTEVELAEAFGFVDGIKIDDAPTLAFVDGVRRQEAAVTRWVDGEVTPGIVGAYGVGCVLVDPNQAPRFGPTDLGRLLVWTRGQDGDLAPLGDAWRWETVSTPETGPKAALRALQERMALAEVSLARKIAEAGYVVVTDGTLWASVGSTGDGVVGYVKTHHRRLLPPAEAAMLPRLLAGQRTSMFSTNRRYSCYLRLVERLPFLAPHAGIVRLEFTGSLAESRRTADVLAGLLPSYAGVLHVDPRAPQNLQPIGALEHRLRHLLGDAGLAERAVRDAVARLE
jgi:hypothetical protein